MPKLILVLTLFVTVVGPIGGATAFARPLDAISQSELEARVAELQHIPWGGKVYEQARGFLGTCRKSTIDLNDVDPATGESQHVHATLVRPVLAKNRPLVLLLPTIEGVTVLEPSIAARLCREGMSSLIVHVNDGRIPEEIPSWGHEDRNTRRGIRMLRTVLDWAQSDHRFDRNKIGVMGISLGGVTASMLAAVEPERLKAVVVTVGGGNIPEILATSRVRDVREFRKRRMGFIGTNDPAVYEEELRKTVRLDPIYFAPLARTENILMVMAERDSSVPYSTQRQLFDALRQPQTMVFWGGHVDSIFLVSYRYMGRVVDFLRERFSH